MSSKPPEMEGWEPILPIVRDKAQNLLRAVTVTASSGDNKRPAALFITIKPAAFIGAPPPHWLRVGAKIWVMRGRGESIGMLRLMPNGPTVVKQAGRDKDGMMIQVRPLEGHPQGGGKRTEVTFASGDAWFDIHLPEWHGPHPAAGAAGAQAGLAAPAPAAASPAAQPAPARAAVPPAKPAGKPFTLAAGASSHPAWNSPKAQAQHQRAVNGGAA